MSCGQKGTQNVCSGNYAYDLDPLTILDHACNLQCLVKYLKSKKVFFFTLRVLKL